MKPIKKVTNDKKQPEKPLKKKESKNLKNIKKSQKFQPKMFNQIKLYNKY